MDLWSKTAVRSHDGVSILWIPRERNMTRLYVELSPTDGERVDKSIATPEYVMNKARQVMAPFKLECQLRRRGNSGPCSGNHGGPTGT